MGFRGNPRPDEPQYPPVGANIDYWLAAEPAGNVRLEILDARGNLIREFSSASPLQIEVADRPGEPLPGLAAAGTPRLSKSAGVHHVVWDLRHPGPWAPNQGQAGRGVRIGPAKRQLETGRADARFDDREWPQRLDDRF